eukprot:TRINITY_DN1528_c0_g1_i1.p1 TRINITY_DN1528_c0_g1~~TRINITY_DN1528_c0_g1_i1.p1  ORF type:complete len:950 (-),score=158.38 TRINITY_DN1528_c0_g1_i1:95-2944(-)
MEASNQVLLAHIRNGMSDLVRLLRAMSPGQLQGLSQFVNPNGWVDMNLAQLDSLLRQCPDDTLMSLLDLGNKFLDGLAQQTPSPEEKQQQEMMQFVQLYHLWSLQQMLREVSFEQLLKLFDILTSKTQIEQLHLLDDFKTLLGQLDKDVLQSLHSEITEISREEPGTEARHLPELIQFEPQHFHLYDPLRQLLQLTLDQFLSLADTLPQWGMVQLLLLTRLREAGAYDVSDYTTLLVPEKALAPEPTTVASQSTPLAGPPPSLMLSILEQPPSKCVYKRNVKPAPTVVINGDQSTNDGNLYIVPILIRCDTLEEETKLLTGNAPQKITATRTVAFKSLKVLTTSHKMNETLFSFQFELRRYNGSNFEVIHRVVSNPVLVLSHSTQLKATPKLLPTVTEVIPFGGPECGGTRVAILGSGFCDSPTVRVKFDQIEVMPIFHGAKTLIVSTPQHQAGTVEVRVCNDLNSWSESAATFTYHGTEHTSQTIATGSDFGFPSVPDTFFSGNPGQGSSSSGAMPSDFAASGFGSSGFSTLHCVAASGDLKQVGGILQQGGSPNVQDKRGNSPLHWATLNSHYSIVLLLLSIHNFRHKSSKRRLQPCDVNIQNEDGETALHWAAREGNWPIAELLLKRGANLNLQNHSGLSPLHIACAIGHVAFVSMLLSCGAVMSVTADGFLPLHLACLGGHPEVTKKLLQADNRASINSKDREGNTPLHCAIASGDINTIKVLLEAPLEPASVTETVTPLTVFSKSQKASQEKLRRLLVELEKEAQATISAKPEPDTQKRQLCNIRQETQEKDTAFVEAQNDDGETPLLLAVALDSPEIAQLLLVHGANVNQSDNNKNTAAHYAVPREDLKMIEILLASGSDFHQPNSMSETAHGLSLLLENKVIAWSIPTKKRSREMDVERTDVVSSDIRPRKRTKSPTKEQIWKPYAHAYPLLSHSVQTLVSV